MRPLTLSAAFFLLACATPHGQIGDALTCKGPAVYEETREGVRLTCEEELVWTGPGSQGFFDWASAAVGALGGWLGGL